MHPDDGKCTKSCTPRQYPGVGVGCGVGVGVGVGTAVQFTFTVVLPVTLGLAVSHHETVSVQPPGSVAPGDEFIGLALQLVFSITRFVEFEGKNPPITAPQSAGFGTVF